MLSRTAYLLIISGVTLNSPYVVVVTNRSLLATRMLLSCWRCVVSALLAGLQFTVIASVGGELYDWLVKTLSLACTADEY